MYYHVWFITKYRKAVLIGTKEKILKDIFSECIKRHNYKVLAYETNKDHVHMLVEAESKKELSTVVRILKCVSAREILGTPHFRVGNIKHFWAKRYGCREIRKSAIASIKKYIRNQKKIPHGESMRMERVVCEKTKR